MGDETKSRSLLPTTNDYVSAGARAIVGAAPFVGSLLAEIAGAVIPNQRIDRIAKFAQALEDKLGDIDQVLVRTKLADENFTDLMEEGLRLAARAVSEERREHLTAVLANGIKAGDLDFLESKHVLRLLGELNDAEIVWLRFYLVPTMGGDEDFRGRHKEALEPVRATLASPQEVHDKEALQKSYRQHLVRLGLIEPIYEYNQSDERPEFDYFTSAQKVSRYEITTLGKLLLTRIGMA